MGAGGLAGVLWQWDRAEGMASREGQARREMRQTLYAAHMNLGEQAWRAGDLARVRELARLHLPEPGEEDLRGWEWYHLWQLGHADWQSLGSQEGRWVRSLSWSRDGERIATGGYDNVVRVWEAGTGRLLHQFDELHKDHIHRVAFDSSGWYVASAGDDHAVFLWDLNRRTGSEVYRHAAKVWAVAFLPDGRLVSADHNGEAFLHRRDGGAAEELPPLEPCGSVTCSPAGDVIAFGCDGGKVFLWDVKEERGEWLRVSEKGLDALSVAIDPAGKTLAVGGREGMVQLWDLQTRRKRHDLTGHALSVWGLDFAPGGRTLVSASWDHRVRLWDVRSGGELATLLGHLDAVKHAAFSPRDGNRLATASKDGTVRLWKLPARQGPVNLRTPGPVTRAWQAGGRLVVQGRDGVAAWRMSDGEPVAPPPEAPAEKGQVVAVSPDGRAVAEVQEHRQHDQKSWAVRLKDAGTGRPSATGPLPANSPVTALAFAPDGRTLVVGDAGGGVKLWDPTSGMEKLSLTGHGSVVGLFFADDGRSLAVGARTGPGCGSPAAMTRCWLTWSGRARPIRSPVTLGSPSRASSPAAPPRAIATPAVAPASS
ncbi:MAG: WD40 repeat domain-containing protein [Gemmataceae bacterium]